MSPECEKVLAAVKAGNASMPDIRKATGIDYAFLTPLLFKLTFDYSLLIEKTTNDGFARYSVATKEDNQPLPAGHLESMPPGALSDTKASRRAREMALSQRAPAREPMITRPMVDKFIEPKKEEGVGIISKQESGMPKSRMEIIEEANDPLNEERPTICLQAGCGKSYKHQGQHRGVAMGGPGGRKPAAAKTERKPQTVAQTPKTLMATGAKARALAVLADLEAERELLNEIINVMRKRVEML